MLNYAPIIESARAVLRMELAGHVAVLLGDIQSDTAIIYRHLFIVYGFDVQPCYVVASETHAEALQSEPAPYFLGVFDENGHANYGNAQDWEDQDRFLGRAVRMAWDRLNRPSPGTP
ncbi:MAG: hypothetical protein HC904_04815 [Blastochloris sp.]|nr:hypothetical protein [Blastochloris sp.]